MLNNAGQTAFYAETNTSGLGSRGIWSEGSGSLALVARGGDHAPGTASGVNFGQFDFDSPALNNRGETAFEAQIIGSGVDSTNDTGIWSEGSGSLALVAREGEHAPGTSSGVNFGNTPDSQSPVLNDAGQTAFYTTLIGSGVNSTNDAGIWSEGSGSLALVAREGDHAPGTSGDSFSDFVFFGSLYPTPALNDAGQTAFWAHLASGGIGIWATDRTGALQLIVRSGDPLEVGAWRLPNYY